MLSTDIAIGSWVALLIFLITALVLICSNKGKGKAQEDKQTDSASVPKAPELSQDRFCPHCGKLRRNNIIYCPRCGSKL